MKCSEIKALLSEYVDETLDTQTKALVDQHLSSCSDCQKELASLRALIKELGSLEAVEPPKDFLNQLHERLEQRSRFSRFIQSLFVPMRIKIPLQVASAAIMAILVFSILHVQQAEYKVAEAPVRLKEEGIAGKGPLDAADMAGEKYGYEPQSTFAEPTPEAPAKVSVPIELALFMRKEIPHRPYAPSKAMEAAPSGARESKRTLARKRPLLVEKPKADESAD
ncbi:MAG: zf-HC2 domain-containing protein, partial [Desulfobacteraceae bacterium]